MQRKLLCVLLVVLAILVGAAAGAADARGHGGGHHGRRGHGHFHGHHRAHVFVGLGSAFFWDPWWYYGPYYGSPVVVEQPPPEYIQRGPVPGYWYYCPSAHAYYPNIRLCPEPWVAVPPRPQ